eukprot:4257819-Alexandrium_andersonii.AAC.1
MAPPLPALSDLIRPPPEQEQRTARPSKNREPWVNLEPLAGALLRATADTRSCRHHCGLDTT